MKTLSPQILAAYIGCEVQSAFIGKRQILEGVYKFQGPEGYWHFVCQISFSCNGNRETRPTSTGIKPILLPLSSITDEHLNEAVEIRNKLFYNKHLDIETRTPLEYISWAAVINFLRAHSYDCDNLIADGLAIDKTTLK